MALPSMGTDSIVEGLSEAFQHYQAARLSEAERICLEILAAQPHSDSAMHLLGLIALRAGRPARAVDWIEKACARNPQNAEAYANLGLALQATGDSRQAAASFERAVELHPGFAEALTNLGNLRLAQGRVDDAIACHRRAVASRPAYAEGWCNLGIALAARNLPADSQEAETCFHRALALNPNLAAAHNNFGLLLQDRGDAARALAGYDRALALKPDYAEAHNNRGFALESAGKLDEAAAEYDCALRLKPRNAEAWNNRGGLLQAQGRLSEAAGCFDRAVALKPDFAIAHYNRALISLLEGDLEAGFRGYEWRWGFLPKRSFPMPRWRGEPLAGQRILLHAEQGLGDAIQFLRYVPKVAAAGGEVVLEVSKPLMRLARELPDVQHVVQLGESLSECGWHCPLMSLPLAFGTRLDSIPARTPYLRIPEAAWRKADRLNWSGTCLRVGLVWAGNPNHRKDRQRTIPFHLLETLSVVRGVEYFSLQLGPSADQPCRSGNGWIADLTTGIEDLADTAALLNRLDLLISVDTAVAHLAGALGVPAWVLLPFAPDWRWLTGGADSPWYPSLRLFRQRQPGDWAPVLDEVRAALAETVATAARSATLPPDAGSA